MQRDSIRVCRLSNLREWSQRCKERRAEFFEFVAKDKAGFCLPFMSPLSKLVLCPLPPPQFSLLLLLFLNVPIFKKPLEATHSNITPFGPQCPMILCLQEPFKETVHILFFFLLLLSICRVLEHTKHSSMGCFFLGCFGFSKKKKRRKSGGKYVSGAESYGRYVPLDSDVAVKLDNDGEMQEPSANELRDMRNESTTAKIKKKVTFNLNVKTYEPTPNEETSSGPSEGEETLWVYNEEETAEASMKYMNYEENLRSSKFRLFPANYRYQNCRDTYDEEDEIDFEDIDSEDEDVDCELDLDEEDFVGSHDCPTISQVEIRQLNSASVVADERVNNAQFVQDRKKNLKQLQPPPNQDVNKTGSNQNARKSSQYVFSVLNPVENLAQWKEVKANSRQQLKLQKENIMLEQKKPPPAHMSKMSDHLPLNISLHPNRPSHELIVDASLSNWLVSSRT